MSYDDEIVISNISTSVSNLISVWKVSLVTSGKFLMRKIITFKCARYVRKVKYKMHLALTLSAERMSSVMKWQL